MQFDAASIAAKQASLTARSLVGQLQLTQQPTTLLYVDNRVPGAALAKPRTATGARVMLSVVAVYRAPDRRVPIPSGNPTLPGAVQAYDTAGGIQRAFGLGRTAEDPLAFSIVVDDDPGAILVGKGLLLDFVQMNFDRLDAQSQNGHAPVRFP